MSWHKKPPIWFFDDHRCPLQNTGKVILTASRNNSSLLLNWMFSRDSRLVLKNKSVSVLRY